MHKVRYTLASTLLAVSTLASATYPDKPVNLLVPFGPGGSTDLIARALAGEMAKTLGQPVVVLNRAGAGGAIGAAEVANARGDGYLVGMLPVGALTTQPNLRRLSYGPGSFDYVCRVYSNPQVLIVRKDAPYQSVLDLVEDAKKHPGEFNYASTGPGSVPHLAMAALTKATGISMVHVPYKGDADSLMGLLGGHVTAFVSHPTLLSSHADKVRGLALMAPGRLKEYPDLATLDQQGGPALSFEVWGGLVVGKGAPPEVRAALEQACRTGTDSDTFRKQLDTLKTPVNYMDAQTFRQFVTSEFDRNGRLLRESGIEKE